MPTLARLSFWVAPKQMYSFQVTYKKKLVPILEKHSLAESSKPGRRSVEDVFSRLFEVETPSEVAVKKRALRNDPAWQRALQNLGTVFGTPQPDGLLHHHFGVYRTPPALRKTEDWRRRLPSR